MTDHLDIIVEMVGATLFASVLIYLALQKVLPNLNENHRCNEFKTIPTPKLNITTCK